MKLARRDRVRRAAVVAPPAAVASAHVEDGLGCEPDGLSVAQLLGDMPMAWEEQRMQLGAPA